MSLISTPTKQLYLYSAPKGSGKSETLKSFVSHLKSKGILVSGILQPVISNKRYIHIISKSEDKLLQLNEINAHSKHKHNCNTQISKTKDPKICYIGPFHFSREVLKEAQTELLQSKPNSWIIIDEIGPLELRKKDGLEPGLSELLLNRKNKYSNNKIVIVIRKSLVKTLLDVFNIKGNEYELFQNIYSNSKDFKNKSIVKKMVYGLVFIGFVYVLKRNSNNKI